LAADPEREETKSPISTSDTVVRHCSCFEEKYLKIFKINQMPASSIKPLYPALPFTRPEDGGGGEGGQKSSVNIGQEEGSKNYKRDGPLHLASKSKIDLMIFRKAALPFVWARSGRQLFETLPDLSQFQKNTKKNTRNQKRNYHF
jgi:hypothetical protein